MARRFGTVFGLAALWASSLAMAQSAGNEATGVRIRRLAGLPAESARGQIEILDVGHHPMDTMLSIVARRTATGWSVSYACAEPRPARRTAIISQGATACPPPTPHASMRS